MICARFSCPLGRADTFYPWLTAGLVVTIILLIFRSSLSAALDECAINSDCTLRSIFIIFCTNMAMTIITNTAMHIPFFPLAMELTRLASDPYHPTDRSPSCKRERKRTDGISSDAHPVPFISPSTGLPVTLTHKPASLRTRDPRRMLFDTDVSGQSVGTPPAHAERDAGPMACPLLRALSSREFRRTDHRAAMSP